MIELLMECVGIFNVHFPNITTPIPHDAASSILLLMNELMMSPSTDTVLQDQLDLIDIRNICCKFELMGHDLQSYNLFALNNRPSKMV